MCLLSQPAAVSFIQLISHHHLANLTALPLPCAPNTFFQALEATPSPTNPRPEHADASSSPASIGPARHPPPVRASRHRPLRRRLTSARSLDLDRQPPRICQTLTPKSGAISATAFSVTAVRGRGIALGVGVSSSGRGCVCCCLADVVQGLRAGNRVLR